MAVGVAAGPRGCSLLARVPCRRSTAGAGAQDYAKTGTNVLRALDAALDGPAAAEDEVTPPVD